MQNNNKIDKINIFYFNSKMYNYLLSQLKESTHMKDKPHMKESTHPIAKPVKKETCDLCYLKRPINKWFSDEFFICNKCASCEHCNKLDDKIKCELDINEITQICESCSNKY
jgi:hypothetical protein